MSLATGKKLGSVRDSKLTMILKESLGGNAKTTLLVAANRWKNNVDESVNTLNFAQRAKQIKNKCKSNVQISPKELQYFVDYMKEEILKLRGQLKSKGIDYHKIADKKVKTLIKDEDFVMEDGSAPEETPSNPSLKNPLGKRSSLIGLTEQDVIIKYCELRAKYDALLQNAGSTIYALNKTVEQSNDQAQNVSNEINSLKVETDEKLQEIVNQKNKEILSLQERIESVKKEHEKIEEDLNTKLAESLKLKLTVEDELESSKKDYESLQNMFEMTNQDVVTFQQEVETHKQLLEEKENELKTLQKELESTTESLKETQNKLADLESKNKETLEKLDEMSRNLLIETENFKNITRQYEELETRSNQQTATYNEDKEKLKDVILQNEMKFNETNNKLKEVEMKLEAEIKSSTDKDSFNQSQIQNLKQENENLNRIIKENISGQEIFIEKEKILEQSKKFLEKRIEEVEEENESIQKQLIESITQSNNEKAKLSLEIENLNFNLKMKNDELKEREIDFETYKKNQEDRFNVEILKSELLQSKLDNSEKKVLDLETVNNNLINNEKKLTFENTLLNKKVEEKQNLLEMQKEVVNKHEEHITKITKENKELKEQIISNSNKVRDAELEMKKFENEKLLINNELEFRTKKFQDAEIKVNEHKSENKVLQDLNRKLQSKIAELELELTRQKRSTIISTNTTNTVKKETTTTKSNIQNVFGVTLKKTENSEIKQKLIDQEKESQLRTQLLFKGNEEFKKIQECIECPSPQTVSSQCKFS